MNNQNCIALNNPENRGEIILYQPYNSINLEVRVEKETVWLNRQQMAQLFDRDVKTIGKHVANALKEELRDFSVVANFATTAADGKIYRVEYFNLDMILSVGYRVKSQRGIQFRIWSNRILTEYILKGHVLHQHIDRVEKIAVETEKRVTETEKKIDFFVRTALPPKEGIFFDGQIFDAYTFISNLIKSAKRSVTLIDNYIDENVLLLLSKRVKGVEATIYTSSVTPQFQLDLQKHNAQYAPITVKTFKRSHDRFLFIDSDVYHIGASLKDLGLKWFAFSKMSLEAKRLEELFENFINFAD